LDGVMRYTNLCLEHFKEDDLIRGYLLEIKHGLDRMANIVKSLLACSRSVPLSRGKINPNYVIDQALQNLKSEIFQKAVHLEKSLGEDLPEINDLGLELVITNIVRNAIDAVKPEGKIKITSWKVQNRVFIQIEDNGCGIPSESINMIFEPFYTTKDIDKGCGLGLTIVNEIIKGYNGRINVESLVGKGAIFTISIP